MKDKIQLNEKWLKASIIGTVWASSEIVLGSFLHNLKVPFSGTFLTAIAIILLISVSYIWKEKGLFWRAGLICALMKTMSPSAIIFGPMIAIFSESVLMEISIRILGRNYLGFLVAAALASSWTFFQKIANFLIFYGFNIVELYKSIMQFTQKQLNLKFDTVWLPILLLLLIYVLVGIVAAVIGIKTGKKLVSNPTKYNPTTYHHLNSTPKNKTNTEFSYSIVWLIGDVLALLISLVLINLTDWYVWILSSIVVVSVWVIRYKRALRQLLRPTFWLFFVLITMLTALVFTHLQSKPVLDAVLIGIEMNFRAMVLILGFSVLGTELYNPKIRTFFSTTYFKQLPLALELSAESLPLVIANIPDFKSLMRNPVLVVSQLIAYAEFRFSELKATPNSGKKIFIITGKLDSGKTTFIKQLIESLTSKNIKVGGIFSQKIYENSELIGYDLIDIQTNNSKAFLRNYTDQSLPQIGKFSILPQSIDFGVKCLKSDYNIENKLVIIDEIGRLELEDKGWAKSVDELKKSYQGHLLLVVRDKFLKQIIEKWNLTSCSVFNIAENDKNKIEKQLFNNLD